MNVFESADAIICLIPARRATSLSKEDYVFVITNYTELRKAAELIQSRG